MQYIFILKRAAAVGFCHSYFRHLDFHCLSFGKAIYRCWNIIKNLTKSESQNFGNFRLFGHLGRKKIFISSLVIILHASSAADYTQIIFDEKESPLIIKKLTQHDTTQQTLSVFEETGRLESHQDELSYRLESPFGVYVAYDRTSERPVAIQTFSQWIKYGYLIAEGMTDVLEAFQGKGYGGKLRTETAKWLSQFLDSKVECGRGEESRTSQLPLAFLYSDNEWMWGVNYPSLKSSLTAGYGIACIAKYPTIQLLYSKNESMMKALWQEDRVSRILSLSKFMMGPAAAPSEISIESIGNDFTYILNDLDLTQETDIVTFLTTYQRVIDVLKDDPRNYHKEVLLAYRSLDKALSTFLSTLDKVKMVNIKRSAEGHRLQEEQKIPIDLLNYCLNSYSDCDVYHLLEE
ncbi:hypothetical protein [Candidatus Odyssella acanthamoebae]|uniref:N-acetyltransferase domain-containing protein n=1 Tax=Candidatus Odyssella acanthamoebae TaxID=91604 RepID=A0A077AYS4_9PROT|nr:hypothetical protein [Candidatus Paracaedibacter acanthamoebae]AIK95865.1 hypothetical protein ID47_02615 [Candidatus Paracaedibacter acanthamoebae]